MVQAQRGNGLAETSGALVETARPGDLDATTATSPGASDPDATLAPGSRDLDATTAATAPTALVGGEAVALARGSLVGRYVVLDQLGAGAMGVVFAAIDPELDRKVAIKLLQSAPDGSLATDPEAGARLVREAQALAKLNHPNVVGVFDVGTHDGRVWLAMELVEGRTLRSWLAERPRGWREILDVIQAAGRGLAAAHAVGLVHRDIKPDNVMIGDDGRVRVMDFGLARRRSARVDDPPPAPSGLGPALLSAEVTHAGAVLGTPAYMAPEQFRGQPVGPPADVFAFCVMLWEGLHGARPFVGLTFAELRASVEAGRIAAPRRGRRSPAWLDAVLVRGLATAPDARWPDMSALLAELARGQARTRRRRALALAGAVAAVVGATYGGVELAHRRTLAACDAEGAAILDDWSADTRAAIERAFTATGKANAATVFARTTPWLDRWAAAWQATQTRACVAHRVSGDLDDELHARAQDCLADHRGSFAALLTEFAAADAGTLTRATPAAAALAAVDGCTDPATLREREPPSSARRAEVLELRTRLGRAASLQSAGKFKEGLALAQEARTAALAGAWPPVIAEAELRVGYLESQLGDYAAAEQSLLRALAAAREARAARPALLGMTQLVYVVGDRGSRFAEGTVWAEAARTQLVHVAGDVRALAAQLDHNLALVHHARSSLDEAQRLNERALAAWIDLYGEEHPQVAQSLNNLANVRRTRGEHAEALPLYERSLAIRARTLGEDHPAVAGSLSNLAVCHKELGRNREALRLHERALAIRERALDPGHPDVVESLNNLAAVHLDLGDHTTALEMYERALAALASGGSVDMTATILYNVALLHHRQGRDAEAARDHARSLELFERLLGEDHPKLTYPLEGLAQSRLRLGEFDEALRMQERALAIREAALGKDHPSLVYSLTGLGNIHRDRGRFDAALALGTRALAIAEAKNRDSLAEVLGGLAETHLAAKRPTEALPRLERALALLPPDDRTYLGPQLRFLLARALWDARADRPRARALAGRAAEEYAAIAGSDAELAKIRAWLAERRE